MKSSPPRMYSRSNATRLLSAGAYLDKVFQKRVIDELLTQRYRVVAPSYGYDAVTVLAHALAARRAQRIQFAVAAAGCGFLLLLSSQTAVGFTSATLLLVLLLWALAFLRRVFVLSALITQVRPIRETSAVGARSPGDGADGRQNRSDLPDLPANPALTPDLVAKIAREQTAAHDVIYYGGYRPFVGAGLRRHEWSMATLLMERQPDPILSYLKQNRKDRGPQVEEPTGSGGLIPFTLDEIMSHVGKRVVADLHDDAAPGEEIPQLNVLRQRYSRAGQLPVKRRRWRASLVLQPQMDTWDADTEVFQPVQNRERYEATREYLCVRIGSWDQELVTTMFVGFDLRGNTFYSEFYSYLLPPVTASFHLVDQLPAQLTGGLMARIAWDALVSLPAAATRTAFRLLGAVGGVGTATVASVPATAADTSEFELGRYAVDLVETGALHSVRELAASANFHHFFQEADATKYVKIVERRLLRIIREFLENHNVDLADYDARQTNILDNSVNYGDATIHGPGNINQGGRQSIRQGGSPGESGGR